MKLPSLITLLLNSQVLAGTIRYSVNFLAANGHVRVARRSEPFPEERIDVLLLNMERWSSHRYRAERVDEMTVKVWKISRVDSRDEVKPHLREMRRIVRQHF
ncbi:hypothetical protein K461DRAFT_276737, partial [Myriangium duriaei CBS 260.36]